MATQKVIVSIGCRDQMAAMRKAKFLAMVHEDRQVMFKLQTAKTPMECFEALKKYNPYPFAIFQYIFNVVIVQAREVRGMVEPRSTAVKEMAPQVKYQEAEGEAYFENGKVTEAGRAAALRQEVWKRAQKASPEELQLMRDVSVEVSSTMYAGNGMLPRGGMEISAWNKTNDQVYSTALRPPDTNRKANDTKAAPSALTRQRQAFHSLVGERQ